MTPRHPAVFLILACFVTSALPAEYLSVRYARTKLPPKSMNCPDGIHEIKEFDSREQANAHGKQFRADESRVDFGGDSFRRGTTVYVYQYTTKTAFAPAACRYTGYGYLTARSADEAKQMLSRKREQDKSRILTEPSVFFVWNGDKLN